MKISHRDAILILMIITCLEIIFLLINPPTGHYIGELINGSGFIMINVPCGTIVRININFANVGSSPAIIYLMNSSVILLSPGQTKGISLLLLPKSYVLCSSIVNNEDIVEVIRDNATHVMVSNDYARTLDIRISGDVFTYISYWVIRL